MPQRTGAGPTLPQNLGSGRFADVAVPAEASAAAATQRMTVMRFISLPPFRLVASSVHRRVCAVVRARDIRTVRLATLGRRAAARDSRGMPELPTGTVTFLFTDIEGSTRLLQEHGDRYAEVLAEHHRLLRELWARHNGFEIGTEGDSFFVAFARASDAVAAAAAVQAALDGMPLRVRIGLHSGEPMLAETGYVGMDVHRAARIAAAAHGGQVLVSEATRSLVEGEGLRDLGKSPAEGSDAARTAVPTGWFRLATP